MKIRRPAVAGRFYPGAEKEIRRQLSLILQKERAFIDVTLAEKKLLGAVVPHAGYMFSAYQAIHFFELLKNSKQQFETFIIVNPNHTGYGPEIALDDNDAWESPLGKVEIDKEFYNLLDYPKSSEAHKFEHSGEVMLPLLQYFIDYPFKIVPITMSRQNSQNARELAKFVVQANKILNKKVCLIASSDFSHFVEPEEGKKMDKYVINEILNLNSDGVYKEVREKNISVCGYGPIMTLIEYSKLISDSPKSKILKIGHSGEVIPSNEVVDYVSILIYE